MKKIMFFGAGNTLKVALICLNRENYEILGVADNNIKIQGTEMFGLTVYPPESILSFNPDIVVISSGSFLSIYKQLAGMGITNDKIVFFPGIYLGIDTDKFSGLKNPADILITGISYAVPIEFRRVSFDNVSAGAQDVFFDSVLTRMFINNRGVNRGVCLVLSQYSLEYDLYLSTNKDIIARYGVIGKDIYNFAAETDSEKAELLNSVLEEVGSINFSYNDFFRKTFKELFPLMDENCLYLDSVITDESLFEKTAKIHSNKNYPMTVASNKRIIENLIVFILSKNIIPIIATVPQHKIYRENFSPRIYSEFIEFINYLKIRYNIEYIDCYGDDYDTKYFFDGDHLNKKGNQIFSHKLEEKILDILG